MPISRINPDGTVKIYNSKTNETKDVSPQDLASFNPRLENDYQVMMSLKSGNSQLNDLPAEQRSQFTGALQGSNIAPPTAESTKLKEAQKFKSDVVSTSKQLITIINNKDQYNPEEYKSLVDSYTSALTTKQKEASNFGASLTANELAILAGQLPVRQDIGQSAFGWVKQMWSGEKPVQTGRVKDSDEEMLRKLNILIPQLSGQAISPDTFAKPTKAKKPSFMENVGTDVKDIVNGILNIPAAVVANAKEVQAQHPDRVPTQEELVLNLTKKIGSGVVDEYNQLLGRPLEGGDILGRMGEHAQTHPVDTVLDVIPPLAIAKKIGLLGKTGKVGKAVETTGLADIPATGAPPAITPSTGSNLVKKTGTNMRSGVRNIDNGPNLFGPERQLQINKTLDTLDITGSPEAQYAKLQPAMDKIGNVIETELKNNPQQFPIKNITDDFQVNLAETIRTGNLSIRKVRQVMTNYIGALHGGKMGDFISSDDLWLIKKAMNDDYKGVKKKLDSGATLTDTEKVIAAGRQTVDDIIAAKYPQIKQLTLMQRDLYDAVDSLYKQSKAGLKVKIPFTGNYLPLPTNLIKSTQDFMGRTLQGDQPGLPNITPTEAGASATTRTLPPIQQPALQTESYLPSYPKDTSTFGVRYVTNPKTGKLIKR